MWQWLFGKPPVPRSPLWPDVEQKAFERDNFTCLVCGCRSRKSLVGHHKLPVSWPGGKEKELDLDNVRTVCECPQHACHLRKGHRGDFRSMEPNFDEEAARERHLIETRPYPAV